MKYLLLIGGPTASGKTELALRLAEHFQTEILSCDSRQFYREMTIGTAKPTLEELARAPHHFVDNLSIKESYTVGDFEKEALALLEQLFEQQEVVVMVGGSGLFMNVVTQGLNKFPDIPVEIKEDLQTLFDTKGIEPLQQELQQVDPDYYAEVDTQNPRRLMRALEVYRTSGQPFSYFRNRPKPQRDFTPIYIALDWEREKLYARINRRVDLMLEAGLEEEARQLYPQRHLKSLQTVGYQELFEYFSGNISKEEAVELIKRNSRRYAKRQMTWLRRESHWNYFKPNDFEGVLAFVLEEIKRGSVES